MSVGKRLIEKQMEAYSREEEGLRSTDPGTLERDDLRIQLYCTPGGERRLMIMFDSDNYSFLSSEETTKLVDLILHAAEVESAANLPIENTALGEVVDGL